MSGPPPQEERCLDENELAAYFDQLLSPEARGRAERHLDGCDTCRELLAMLARTQIGAAKPAEPPAAQSGVRAALLSRGAQVGRFLVLEPVGTGAMGIVYAAYDPALDRKVALKLLHPEARTSESAAQAMQRLLREAQAIARLSHPNVVTVYEFGTYGDGVFLAMELVEGITLREWCATPRPWREVARYFLYAGRGLSAAHDAGLVHRDFKPANVLVGTDGRIRVVDFGLVRTGDASATGAEVDVASVGEGLNTQSGAILGTPAYMAPEQLRGEAVDARADQFAFCVSAYEALYGTRPYPGPLGDALKRMLAHDVAPPQVSCGPTRLRRALVRGLSPDPKDRFPSMRELLLAFEQSLSDRTLRRATQVGALVVLVGLLAALVTRDRTVLCSGAEAALSSAWSAEVGEQLLSRVSSEEGDDAKESTRRLVEILERQAGRWIHTHREVCEATRVRREQPESVMALRMACLDRRRRELAAVVEAARAARPERLERAADLARVLRPIEECDLTDVSSHQPEPPAAVAHAVRALRDEVARLDAFRHVAPDEALAPARELTERVRAIAFAPLQAEALALLGAIQLDARRYEESEDTLLQAIAAAERGAHDEPRLRAELSLADLLGNRQRRFREADARLIAAEAILERLGRSPTLEAEWVITTGLVRFQQRRYDEALEFFRRGHVLRERLYGVEDPRTWAALINTAQALKGKGAFAEAAEAAKKARDQLRASLGPRHSMTLTSEISLGSIYFRLGRAEEALASFQAARLENKADSARDAAARIPLVDVLIRLGRLDEAERHVNDVAAWLEAKADQNDLLFSSVRMARARLALARGEVRTAVALHDEEVRFQDRLHGAESLATAEVRLESAQFHLEANRSKDALRIVERALKVMGRELPHDAAALARARAVYGEVLLATGERQRAARELEAALRVQAVHEPDPLLVARTRVLLARALGSESGERDRVDALLTAAGPAISREPGAADLRQMADELRRALSL